MIFKPRSAQIARFRSGAARVPRLRETPHPAWVGVSLPAKGAGAPQPAPQPPARPHELPAPCSCPLMALIYFFFKFYFIFLCLGRCGRGADELGGGHGPPRSPGAVLRCPRAPAPRGTGGSGRGRKALKFLGTGGAAGRAALCVGRRQTLITAWRVCVCFLRLLTAD